MPENVKRRDFLAGMGSALGGLVLGSGAGPADARAEAGGQGLKGKERSLPTTNEIRQYLLKNSPWVNLKNTVDTVKCGDPDRPVKKAGVAWFSSIGDIRAAIRAGCDLLVVHEPTFWEHAAPEQSWRKRGPGIAKSKALAESGLVILRAHDTWDNWPGMMSLRDHLARQFPAVEFV